MSLGDFNIDRLRQTALLYPSARPPKRALLALMLLNSELHCVAEYRLGRHLRTLRGRDRWLALPLMVLDRIWHRWVTHIHHCSIDGGAQIGPGLLLMHRTGIIVGPSVIGRNCVLHQNVTVGERVAGGLHGIPRIGDNVWIGPGAILSGAITVGEGSTISAGAVVSRDVPARSLVSGNPGRVIARDYDNTSINRYATSDARGGG